MGEATLAELWDDFCRQKDFEDPLLVPAKKGVYCIRIPAGMAVTFKGTIDNHPGAAYPIESLEAKCVPSSDILYIGKANGEKGLFQRLRQYMRYGFDAGNNHRGGRAIFQVEGYENLTSVDWLWFPYIPFGKLTIIQGNPGEGKTYFAMRLAAACTNRKPLPGMETLEPFNIIYQTAEDGLGDTVKPRLMEADADLERVLVIDDRDTPLTLADERIARAIRENNARLVIIDPVQAFLGADVDMNRANEVRPIFRSLGDIAQATGCAIVLIGHLNKAAGTQSTYRGLGSIDITAAVRSLLFIGKLKDSPTTRVLIHEKSSLAPPGQSIAFSLGDEKGFAWIGAYDITADELLAGTDTAKTESKTAQAQMLILELLADGKRMPSAELEKAVNERGISSRTMRTAKSRIGDRLVTEKDGTAWVCYLRD